MLPIQLAISIVATPDPANATTQLVQRLTASCRLVAAAGASFIRPLPFSSSPIPPLRIQYFRCRRPTDCSKLQGSRSADAGSPLAQR